MPSLSLNFDNQRPASLGNASHEACEDSTKAEALTTISFAGTIVDVERGDSRRRAAAKNRTAVLLSLFLGITGLSAAPAGAGELTCKGRVVTIPGTPTDNDLEGTPGDDVIHGRKGADSISGGGGDDVICAGAGEDTVSGGPEDDRLYGSLGRDELAGDGGADFISGGTRQDSLSGGDGADDLYGQGWPDRMAGGPGDDRLVGGDDGADMADFSGSV